jgi:hypothetical protein
VNAPHPPGFAYGYAGRPPRKGEVKGKERRPGGSDMAIRWKWLVVLCALFAAGCYDTKTAKPIGTTAGFVQDKSLIGIWKDDHWRVDSGDYLHIFPVNAQEMTLLWIEAPKGADRGSFSQFRVTTAKLGNNRFLNVAKWNEQSVEEAVKERVPVFYTLRNGGRTLTIYLADDERVAKAIESGALKGVVEKHLEKRNDGTTYADYDKIEITAEPAELDAFMAKPEAAELFKVFMVLKKVE